jgi:hypothetical protein
MSSSDTDSSGSDDNSEGTSTVSHSGSAAAPKRPEDPTENIGGSSRFVTLLTIVFHGVHVVLNIATYLTFVRFNQKELGPELVTAYLAFSIGGALSFLFVSSIFYMWAWRYPEPEEVAKRRRIRGVVMNLFIVDFPMFIIGVNVVWYMNGLSNPVQSTNFVWSMLSMCYSILRVWTFYMVKIVRQTRSSPADGGDGDFDGAPGTVSRHRRGASYATGRSDASSGGRTRGHFRVASRDIGAAADASDEDVSSRRARRRNVN